MDDVRETEVTEPSMKSNPENMIAMGSSVWVSVTQVLHCVLCAAIGLEFRHGSGSDKMGGRWHEISYILNLKP